MKNRYPKTEKYGGFEVTIYQGTDGRFTVCYWCLGERKRQYFRDEAEALSEAKRIAESMATGQVTKVELTAAEIVTAKEAIRLLAPTGVPLLLAVSQFVQAHEKLGGRSLVEAVDQYVKIFPTSVKSMTVKDAAAEMVKAKELDGARENYIRTIERHMRRVSKAFACPLMDVTPDHINTFLRTLKNVPRSRNDTRAMILMLFKLAALKGYVPKGYIDPEQIAWAKEPDRVIEIYTPDELKKLIAAARLTPAEAGPHFNKRYLNAQGLLPLLVLGAFAGMRSSEVEGQQWSDIHEARGFIRVTNAKPNTPAKRLIDIQPNLLKWLEVCKRPHDRCCVYDNVDAAIVRLAKRAQVRWKHNGLRHSFISYRLALIKNVNQTALEAGNSPQMIFAHYRELVTEEEAKEWFAILP